MHFDADRAICQIIDSKICDENVISGFTVKIIELTWFVVKIFFKFLIWGLPLNEKRAQTRSRKKKS